MYLAWCAYHNIQFRCQYECMKHFIIKLLLWTTYSAAYHTKPVYKAKKKKKGFNLDKIPGWHGLANERPVISASGATLSKFSIYFKDHEWHKKEDRQDLDQLHIYCRKLWNKVFNRGAVAFPWCSWCRELWRSASSSSAETPGSSQPGGCCRPALPQSSWHDQRPQPDTEPEHDRWQL